MWFETSQGTRYTLPDMLVTHVDAVVDQLHNHYNQIMALNISDCCLTLPLRILKQAGVGERCMWEAH